MAGPWKAQYPLVEERGEYRAGLVAKIDKRLKQYGKCEIDLLFSLVKINPIGPKMALSCACVPWARCPLHLSGTIWELTTISTTTYRSRKRVKTSSRKTTILRRWLTQQKQYLWMVSPRIACPWFHVSCQRSVIDLEQHPVCCWLHGKHSNGPRSLQLLERSQSVTSIPY